MRIGLIVVDDGIYTHQWVRDILKLPRHNICVCACLSPFYARNFNPHKNLINSINFRLRYYGLRASIKFYLLFLKNRAEASTLNLNRQKRVSSVRALISHDKIPLVPIQNQDVNHPDFLDKFKQYNPQVLLGVFSQKAELPLRTLAPLGCLNIHFSYLPDNAGREPVFWSLLEGKGYGLTIYRMGEVFDSGEILAQCRLASDGLFTLDEAIKNICMHIPEVLTNALDKLERGTDTMVLKPKALKGWPKPRDTRAFLDAGYTFC